ncbi:MAG: hypothetical protein LH478_00485 [Chitinophagaceae bacterium]|nr:hypothetical protein [Chitinophagaceae bacterium]
MSSNEILELLTRLLAPLKLQPQDNASGFEKFQDVLKQALSQPSFEIRNTSVQFRSFESTILPDGVTGELKKISEEIIAAQATRKPDDPVFWLRQRSMAVTAGIEESIENFLEPELSFGPFINAQSKKGWFDFFRMPVQVKFQVAGMQDALIIALAPGDKLPTAGRRTTLSFADCTIWVSAKTVNAKGDKKYAGIRAKKCDITFSTIAEVFATGIVSVISTAFKISFEPFDKFNNGIENNAQPKATYPDKIVLSFTGTKWSLKSFNKSAINVNGDSIEFNKSANINPVYLEPEDLIHFPLSANKDLWESVKNDKERFQLDGKATFTNTGWYLPVVNTDNSLATAALGMNIFSGYLGFRGKDGITLGWPGLEHGKLTISKLLMLVRPGRINLKYTYAAAPRIKQQLVMWKGTADANTNSLITIKPMPAGEGMCLDDNQDMEALILPVNISARVDRPLNTAQKRFDISGHEGAALFLKITGNTSVLVIGSRRPAPAGQAKKRRIPQSLCLSNALLTVDNPVNIFLEGKLEVNDIISQGFLYTGFPVYRLTNTLPDPYLSNQDLFFDQDFFRFNELWRTGQDTLNDQFLFSVTAAVQWKENTLSVEFNINQQVAGRVVTNTELFERLGQTSHPCQPEEAGNGSLKGDLAKLKDIDPENVLGAYGFLQTLPGNRSLLDVSGSANLWGVSFSDKIPDDKTPFVESLGFSARFPFRIKDMDLVSSGRMSRLFTLPHIQWEPVMKIENPAVKEPGLFPIIIYNSNGNPTRISSASKGEVVLTPSNLYDFIIAAYNNIEKPQAAAANFTLPFGICAFAYFNPGKIVGQPGASAAKNEPAFSGKKTGELNGAMQLQIEATPIVPPKIKPAFTPAPYFIGSARLLPKVNNGIPSILGTDITKSFSEFSNGPSAKVPLQRIDFSGYGASIFSNWQNDQANFGRVNQVKFDVLIGRTAHEVVQIKSILFPWGVPVVRSIVIQRKNSGVVIRRDSGWIAQGPGEFNFLSNKPGFIPEVNPYNFHPGLVTGIYNVTEIRELPNDMDIPFPGLPGKPLLFSGVYFNGDIEIENIIKGGVQNTGKTKSRVHSKGQFGYVMLADPALVTDITTLAQLFKPLPFKQLINNPKVGGSLGGPVNAIMNIAGTGQRMQITRVDVSASNEPIPSFVVAVRGTIELPKEGSWTVVKCLPSKDIVPLIQSELVPLIRNGLLSINSATGARKTEFANSNHCLGDPAEIDKYALNAVPLLQYSLLQTTGTQKLLFRRPSFVKGKQQIFTEVPDLADAFRLLKGKTIFPNLADTLSLPDAVRALNITGNGSGLKFDDSLFAGAQNLNKFIPRQLSQPDPNAKVFKLIDESGFQVFITYESKEKNTSEFKVDLSSDAIDNAVDGARKKWQTVNKDVAIVVNLGSIKPLLTLRGQFRSEAGSDPVFEKPECELGPELNAVKDILKVLGTLALKGDVFADSLKVIMGNSPDSWNYKMSIEQRIPVIQFPSTEQITLATPPPLIIEASLLLGVFFNLSLSPDPKNLIKPGAGAVFGFEGMIQIQLITIGIAAAYGVGITKVKAYVDLTDPKPQFDFTFGFGATVIVDLPVVGLASITRSFSLTGDISSGRFIAVAGQMLRGVLSLAGGLLIVAIQIEGSTGVESKNNPADKSMHAVFEMIFSLDVSLAFVISYDFTKRYTEKIKLS